MSGVLLCIPSPISGVLLCISSPMSDLGIGFVTSGDSVQDDGVIDLLPTVTALWDVTVDAVDDASFFFLHLCAM